MQRAISFLHPGPVYTHPSLTPRSKDSSSFSPGPSQFFKSPRRSRIFRKAQVVKWTGVRVLRLCPGWDSRGSWLSPPRVRQKRSTSPENFLSLLLFLQLPMRFAEIFLLPHQQEQVGNQNNSSSGKAPTPGEMKVCLLTLMEAGTKAGTQEPLGTQEGRLPKATERLELMQAS